MDKERHEKMLSYIQYEVTRTASNFGIMPNNTLTAFVKEALAETTIEEAREALNLLPTGLKHESWVIVSSTMGFLGAIGQAHEELVLDVLTICEAHEAERKANHVGLASTTYFNRMAENNPDLTTRIEALKIPGFKMTTTQVAAAIFNPATMWEMAILNGDRKIIDLLTNNGVPHLLVLVELLKSRDLTLDVTKEFSERVALSTEAITAGLAANLTRMVEITKGSPNKASFTQTKNEAGEARFAMRFNAPKC